MRGKAQSEPARRAKLFASALTITKNTVTECAFCCSYIYFTGYFQAIGTAGFLFRLNEHQVGNFGEDRFSILR